MKKHATMVLIVFFSVWLAGCGAIVRSNKYMTVIQPDLQYKPAPGYALVIFKRENRHVGEYRTLSVWNITNKDDPEFIALLSSTMKAAWQVKAGEYYLMQVIAGVRDVMKAKVDTDKTYYAIAGPGYWNLSQNNTSKISHTGISIVNKEALNWANSPSTRKSIQSHISKGMRRWNSLNVKEQAKKTINPEDGREY